MNRLNDFAFRLKVCWRVLTYRTWLVQSWRDGYGNAVQVQWREGGSA